MRIASNKDEPKGSSELGVFLWHDSGVRQREGFVKPKTCDLSPTGTYIQTIGLVTEKRTYVFRITHNNLPARRITR